MLSLVSPTFSVREPSNWEDFDTEASEWGSLFFSGNEGFPNLGGGGGGPIEDLVDSDEEEEEEEEEVEGSSEAMALGSEVVTVGFLGGGPIAVVIFPAEYGRGV